MEYPDHMQGIVGEMLQFEHEGAFRRHRFSFILRPKLSFDGDSWCALYGENLQDGVAGFGRSPNEAYTDFDNNWERKVWPKVAVTALAHPKGETDGITGTM